MVGNPHCDVTGIWLITENIPKWPQVSASFRFVIIVVQQELFGCVLLGHETILE